MKTVIPKEARLYIIPLSYLREGTRFVAHGGNNSTFTGVTTMDGHAVSDRYGLRQGNTYYSDNPERNYINVKIDGVRYGDHPCDRDELGNRLPINSGIYESDNLRIFVNKDAYDRYKKDLDWNSEKGKEDQRAYRKAVLVAKMEALTKELENL